MRDYNIKMHQYLWEMCIRLKDNENRKVAKRGGSIAGNARKEIEKETGKPVITSKNAVDMSISNLQVKKHANSMKAEWLNCKKL